MAGVRVQGPATCHDSPAFCPYVLNVLSQFRHTKSSLTHNYKWLLRCRQQCLSHCVHQAFYLANHSPASSCWRHLKFWIQEEILEFYRKSKPLKENSPEYYTYEILIIRGGFISKYRRVYRKRVKRNCSGRTLNRAEKEYEKTITESKWWGESGICSRSLLVMRNSLYRRPG
jgi:hypothetical protein